MSESRIILPAVTSLEIGSCGDVNLQVLHTAFPGVTHLEMGDTTLVELSEGESREIFPHLQKVKLDYVEGLSILLGAVRPSGKW